MTAFVGVKRSLLGAHGGPPPVNTEAPVVSGPILKGATLTVTTGTWEGASSFAYQWRRGGVDIPGANGNSHVVGDDDVGNAMSARVTATNPGGSAGANSNSTEEILEALLWYDLSDLSTLFQDDAGTTPVTTDGQLIRYIEDKSGNGHHAINSGASSGVPVYNTSGGLHWATFVAASTRVWTIPSPLNIQESMTEVGVFERAASGINTVGLSNNAGAHALWWFSDNKFYEKLGGTESSGSTADTATGNFVLTSRRDASTAIGRKNKAQVLTRAAPAVSSSFTKVGQPGGVTFATQKLYALVVVGAETTVAQMEALETQFGLKAGLSI
jgi:hypothetical protein